VQRTGISLQAGGVMTVRNTGSKPIRQFDMLVWDFPDPNEARVAFRGEDKAKLYFALKPYDVV